MFLPFETFVYGLTGNCGYHKHWVSEGPTLGCLAACDQPRHALRAWKKFRCVAKFSLGVSPSEWRYAFECICTYLGLCDIMLSQREEIVSTLSSLPSANPACDRSLNRSKLWRNKHLWFWTALVVRVSFFFTLYYTYFFLSFLYFVLVFCYIYLEIVVSRREPRFNSGRALSTIANYIVSQKI